MSERWRASTRGPGTLPALTAGRSRKRSWRIPLAWVVDFTRARPRPQPEPLAGDYNEEDRATRPARAFLCGYGNDTDQDPIREKNNS